jgi:hypothetical protein
LSRLFSCCHEPVLANEPFSIYWHRKKRKHWPNKGAVFCTSSVVSTSS